MGKWIHSLTKVDLDARTAVCANCGPVRVIIKKRANGSPRPRCREVWRQQARDYYSTPKGKANIKVRRDRASKGEHGLSRTEAREYADSTGCCEICGDIEDLTVDHDHVTGVIRGVLCRRCNFGLGHFRDNAIFLDRAKIYLESRE